MSSAPQQELLRAAAPAAETSPGYALVGGQRYELVGGPDGGLSVVIPGVDGTEDTAAIPERLVRFIGAPVVVSVQLRQSNRLMSTPEPGSEFVGVITGWSIALDGVVVYGGMLVSIDPQPALVQAAATLPRLLALPIKLQDEGDWLGRLVYLDGRTAVIAGLRGNYGELILMVGEEEHWVPILSDRIAWETSPDE